jgi:pyruvate,water dikinase
MPWILSPSDPACLGERVAGGKGSSLARLCALGANVPPFVVVSAEAHRAIRGGEPPAAFLVELRKALATLNLAGGLAVRSSALGEDAADSSFAGLYHTSLEVSGFEAIVAAIRTCWASYGDAAATEYRQTRTEERDGAMAVVIQEMIQGEWSGVCFTANPVTLCLSQTLINAVPGLGEALVSGEVNPEEITVATADGRLLDRRPGADPPQLPEVAVAEVWRTCKDIADQLGFPQDVEWAWRGGKLFILQSRPVTTIADVFYSRKLETWRDDPQADPDAPDRIWTRMLADETWVSPISPLFYNVHNSAPGRVRFFEMHGDKAPLPPDMFKYHQATAYAGVRWVRRMYEFQPRLARIRGVLNFFPAAMQEDFRHGRVRWLGRLRRMLAYEFKDREHRSFFRNYRVFETQWPPYVAQSDGWFDLDLDTLTLDELRAHQAEVRQAMARVGPPCGIAVLSHAADLHMLLTGLLDRWNRELGSDGENLYARVSSGLDDSETVREGDALWELGRGLTALGADAARADTWSDLGAQAADLVDGPAFIDAFEAFWRAHRHLGSTYKDLIWPRWGDDIDQCFAVVKAHADSAAERPSVINARSATARRAAQAEILGALHGPLAPARRAFLKWLFRYNELYMAVRDNHRFYVDRNWYALRRIYRSYGARLVARGVLKDRDEVFFLGTEEIEDALQGALADAKAARRVEVRRRVWETTLRRQGPKFLKGWTAFEDRPAAATEVAGQLCGIAASPGFAVGAARVVYDVRELSTVKDGEILVTRQTDPSWTTVFGRIGGLVLETGGVLSHGTSLCREYGLPCVTAVERATIRIPDGSRIELMGGEGTIRILEAS